VATAKQELVIELEARDLERVIDRVVANLGWDLSRPAADVLRADEDATKLHCHCAPLHAEMVLGQRANQTKLTIRGKVPGWGPVASQHVRRQTDLLARRVGLAAVQLQRS
jgi:hypothetical protein